MSSTVTSGRSTSRPRISGDAAVIRSNTALATGSRFMTGTGALGGAFWGLLFGLLSFTPILGMAAGAGAGALGGPPMSRSTRLHRVAA